MRCRLCGGEALPFPVKGRVYGDCPSCGCVCLEEGALPSPAAEEARYRLHRNGAGDPGYRRFLESFIDRAVRPFLAGGARVLDFGSGPEPLLTALLAEGGYESARHDPYFAPGEGWRDSTWDCVILHEVAEHLFEPGDCLRGLAAVLAPGGLLAIRTRFFPGDRAAFGRWWYREDPTHVCFYRPESFTWLAREHDLEVRLLEEPDLVALGSPRGGRAGAARPKA